MGSSKKKPGALSHGGAHSNLPPEVAAAKAELIDVEIKRTALVEELRLVEKQVKRKKKKERELMESSFFFSLHFLDLLLLSSTLSTHFSTSPSSPSRPPLHSPHSNQTTTDLRPRDALPRHGQPGRDRPERLRRPLVLLGGRGRRRRRRRRRRGREEAAGREGRGALLLEVEHHWAAPRSQVRERKNQNCNKHNELHSEKKEDKRERRCYNIKIKKSPSVF